MGLIAKRERFRVGGLRVVIRLMTLNIGLYKRYGTIVIVRATRRRRRRANLRVAILNDYFVKETYGSAPPVLVHWGQRGTSSSAKRRTRLSEFAIGQSLDFNIVGVYSQCLISANGEERLETVIDGEVPSDFVSSSRPRF